ncbi:hypothetical protein DD238_008568 [Peronospora effusa]|uniref:Uncharacterized protein n=1 Tax=Peronospora effusa TaxID=542832 RepID=A0A3M6V724_9STRA|nr:hypothetical protein DD238_008568 [Peronospora effusa]RQM15213.1 hypothetical protein DD237_002707 [Peronospora effusa]
MDLSEIPFGVPVILQSIRKNRNLQNPLGSKKARCLTDNRDIYEQLILHRVRDDKIAIQSGHNGRFLQVLVSGGCLFDPTEPSEWELFTMETDSSCALYFVSCTLEMSFSVTTIMWRSVRIKTAKMGRHGESWSPASMLPVTVSKNHAILFPMRSVLSVSATSLLIKSTSSSSCGKKNRAECDERFDGLASSALAISVAKK